MSLYLSTSLLMTAPIGGEIVRLDNANSNGTARLLTLTNDTNDSFTATLPDLGTGLSKILWQATPVSGGYAQLSQIKSPLAIAILLDPGNTYADGLARDTFAAGKAPVATIELQYADAGTFTNVTTLGVCFELYREFPLLLPGYALRSAIDGATQNKVLYRVAARSNLVSGFGPVKIRGAVFG